MRTVALWLAAVAWTQLSPALAGPAPTAPSAEPEQPALRLSRAIDREIALRWRERGVQPASLADDEEFFRRVHLDLAGKIPPAIEARDFLADGRSDKRLRAIDSLLDSPGYVSHFASFWRNVMMPEVNADFRVQYLAPSFEAWLRRSLVRNTPYDRMAREVLTVPLTVSGDRNVVDMAGAAEPTPLAFYQAKQVAPAELAAATSRIFLGLRIECAQCHHHPTDNWKQEQFWSFAAIFAGIERGDPGVVGAFREVFNRRQLTVPGTKTVVEAAFLDGNQPQWRFRVEPRDSLAIWMTSPRNPYFARATVNRIWGYLFGVGLVDPVDDFSSSNEPSHPRLLQELADQFIANRHDLKFLIRAITGSQAYQLSSRKSHSTQDDPRLFARKSVKGMMPGQWFDSLAQATGFHRPFSPQQPFIFGPGDVRTEFLELFSNQTDRPTEQQTTILQALAVMNGSFVASATQPQHGGTLSAIVDFPFASTAERIEGLYWATLSRRPTPAESKRLVEYVDSGGPKKDPNAALADVFWSLLNCGEFAVNH